jgi:uncharacterized membrane protein HdeD (DUF308 family)
LGQWPRRSEAWTIAAARITQTIETQGEAVMFAKILSRYWWMTLLRGVLWLLFGAMLFAQPGISIAALAFAFGLFVLADGIGNVVTAFGGRDQHDHWWVLLIVGLLGIGIGLLSVLNPGLTALALLFYIAIWAIAAGVLQVVAAIRLRQEIEGEVWLILGGLASVAFGALAIARPGAGALSILWLIGAYAIVYGLVLVVLAFKARGFATRLAGTLKARA